MVSPPTFLLQDQMLIDQLKRSPELEHPRSSVQGVGCPEGQTDGHRDTHLGFHLAIAGWALALITVGALKARLADAAPITPACQGLGPHQVAVAGCGAWRQVRVAKDEDLPCSLLWARLSTHCLPLLPSNLAFPPLVHRWEVS